MSEANLREKNRKTVRNLLIVVAGMVGFAFALVPLYNVFCQVTGINGKTGGPVAENAQQEDAARQIDLQFIAQLSKEMDVEVEFRPETYTMKVHPGKTYVTRFYIKNKTDKPLVFQAVPSLAPGQSALYFHKIECFCFNQQPLAPGEAKWMPLRFFVDTALQAEVHDIALSYTLYDITKKVATPAVSS